MFIDWFHFELLMRILLAFLLGAVLGWEREQHGKHAGIRTYGAICLGACVFGIVSHLVEGADPARISAQVVMGIGFIGAGVIFQSGSSVEGLTTAASLWTTASIGLAIAYGAYAIGILTCIVLFSLLYMPELSWWSKVSARRKRSGPKIKSK